MIASGSETRAKFRAHRLELFLRFSHLLAGLVVLAGLAKFLDLLHASLHLLADFGDRFFAGRTTGSFRFWSGIGSRSLGSLGLFRLSGVHGRAFRSSVRRWASGASLTRAAIAAVVTESCAHAFHVLFDFGHLLVRFVVLAGFAKFLDFLHACLHVLTDFGHIRSVAMASGRIPFFGSGR
jgi:hypothetical protein